MSENVHGTAVLVGAQGVLIRGGSGAGKSALAHALISRGARLIADDRVCLSARGGRILATAPSAISGLIELRGRGLVALPHERFGVIRLVVDIVKGDELQRMPEAEELAVELLGVTVSRQPVPAAIDPALRLVHAALDALSPRRNMGLRSAQV